jgi:hypothetical protein
MATSWPTPSSMSHVGRQTQREKTSRDSWGAAHYSAIPLFRYSAVVDCLVKVGDRSYGWYVPHFPVRSTGTAPTTCRSEAKPR